MNFLKKYHRHFIYQLASLIFLILVFMLCAYLLIIRYSTDMVRKNTLDMNKRLLAQTETRVRECWDSVYNVAAAFCYSPTALQYLSGDSLSRLPDSKELASVFSNTLLLDEHILSAYLYDNSLVRIAAMGKEFPLSVSDADVCASMEIRAESLNGKRDAAFYEVWYPIYNLESPRYQDMLGICIFILDPKILDDALADSKATENSSVFLFDADGNILTSTENAPSLSFSALASEGEENIPWHFYSHSLSFNGWNIVSLIPKEDLQHPDHILNYIAIAAFFISFILFFILIIYYNWKITIPLQNITTFIRNTNTEPLKRLSSNRKDEIGIVANSLNQMLDENKRIQEELRLSQRRIYETEIEKKQAEILAYRNQINPHFLYNTFECIRGMALYHEAEDIAEITMALSNVFRFAVKGEDIVTVGEEIDYILEYAKIIDYRFMGKISVDVSVQDDIREKKLFKLLLQPLVENAVFHGLEQKMTEGLVEVTIFAPDNSHLCFIIEDNGCGIEPEKLKEIQTTLESQKNTSRVGLFNIYQRLKLFYSDNFQFQIESRQSEGTRITILIPDSAEKQFIQEGQKYADNLYC